jgi:hypothetical protein
LDNAPDTSKTVTAGCPATIILPEHNACQMDDKMKNCCAIAMSAALALMIAPCVNAESKLQGISFDIMPVGCRIHARFSSGEQVVDEYIGKKGNKHITKTFGGAQGKSLIRTTTFNSNGFMIRKDWAGGKWETFAPYSCFDVPGACSYRYRNADGQDSQFDGKVARRGANLLSTGGFVGDIPFPDAKVTIGPFNAGIKWADAATSFAVTKYENCGDINAGS